ncbi:hypothetical protein K7X08_016383 [Anisodus acutangulus]|uniref:NECAP PHear domain-containing protein n=1 Tax=Anisodus acutangulus TaxID=402998 RepID=A0A9Q1LH70_9SOLA|nr:hypothetical protein K7X08_016383 [Anisodus acutangulus]
MSANRNEAFDFNVALSDHEKYVKRENDKEVGDGEAGDDNHIDYYPAVNHQLKEGETIRINVKNKPSSGTGMLSAVGLAAGTTGAVKKPHPLRLHLVEVTRSGLLFHTLQMIQPFLERLLLLPVLLSWGQRKMPGIPLIHFQISLKLREAFLLPLDPDQVKPQQLDGQHF